MNHDPVKQAWQASVEIAGAPPLDEVRKGADRFYRYIKWRNLVEYAACVIVVVSFAYYIFTLPHLLQKVGSAMTVAATLYVAWQLHSRASAEPPERAGTMPILAFARTQLVRQRDALKAIFWWYILPFLPGMAVMMAGNMATRSAEADGGPGPFDALGMAAVLLMIAGIWWLNQHGARRLKRHIDEIDALMGGDG